MKLTEIQFGTLMPVDGYGPGMFRVGGRVMAGPTLVLPDRAMPWGGLADTAPLLALAGAVDVLFCGMGAEIAHLPRPLRSELESLGLGVEVMNTPAAARTYNVCLSEGRRVAAALLPV
ncbi:MAG: Mth938-like domain-containing protein [Gemmobacter sp.]|uniref:Mth938-like domain-containing protein n=1 Tax=Gemmobacter sp. TaxID=1898957 RepID=UPI00391A0D6B